MEILSILFLAVIALSHGAILLCILADWVGSIKRKREKKNGKAADNEVDWWDEEEIEPCVPELSQDALLHLKPNQITKFVYGEIYPTAPRVLSHMTLLERRWAELLLNAYIGFLLDTAIEEEQDFSVLLELLYHSSLPVDSDRCSVTEMVMEESKHRIGETGFYETYQKFKRECQDKPFIIQCCYEIVSVIVVKLYGYIPSAVHSKAIFDAVGGYDEYDK